VRSHGGPWLWDDGVAVATEGLRVDPGRRVPAVDDGRREVKAKRRWGARARVVWAAKRGGGRLVHREGGVCSGGRAGANGNRAWEVGVGRMGCGSVGSGME
jgi:hypothetical protein